jgi:hypothetical protein
MPDWQALVGEQFAAISLEPEERREVIAELAGHLEESFEQLRRQGLSEGAAVERALSQVKNWQSLRRRIQKARMKEDVMTDRVKQIWLPGFLTLFLSVILLMANEIIGIKLGINPLIVSAHGSGLKAPVAVIYVPWVVSLLLIGAIGAYLALRAGASPLATLLPLMFPVLPHSIFFVIWIPVSLILGDHISHNTMPRALLMGLVAWVVLPGVALLAGGLPVQLQRLRRSTLST